MASSEGSAHSQWRRFFASAGGADIFEIIDAAVAVSALDRPAELKQRRERIAQRLYTEGVLSCGTGSVHGSNKDLIAATPMKGRRRSMAVTVSKEEDGPSESSAAPVKNDLVRKNSAKPPTAAADRNKAPAAQPSEPLQTGTTKRRLREGYDEYTDSKRQRGIQVIVAPEMATQHQSIRRRDEFRIPMHANKARPGVYYSPG